MRHDAQHLFELFKHEIRRPANDQAVLPDHVWEYLTQAQDELLRMVAMVRPELNYAAPFQLTSIDDNYTFTFGTDEDGNPREVFGMIELYRDLNGKPLQAGSFYNRDADYVFEGDRIRFPAGIRWRYGSAPYVRGVLAPGPIDQDHEPVVRPLAARAGIPLLAAIKWAEGRGRQNPKPFKDKFDEWWIGRWNGNLQTKAGFVDSLRTAVPEAAEEVVPEWWHSIDTGRGYTRYE